ncbi:MAG TPA: hypothetical protein VD840_07630 [Sinorhizobium sp.]|nr:hypothetical protein [Sinorhizobium sp.]
MNCTSVANEERRLERKSKDDARRSNGCAPEGQGLRDEAIPESANIADRGCAHSVGSNFGFGRVITLMLVSLGPALFWTAGLALAAKLFGFAATPSLLASTFLPIFSFLLVACSPCFLRHEETGASAPEQSGSGSEAPQTSFAFDAVI